MPGIDGIGVLDALSSGPLVIILSAFEYRSQAEMRVRFSRRVCRFLPKPVPPRHLVRAVDACLACAA
jgi:hypothetical protein